MISIAHLQHGFIVVLAVVAGLASGVLVGCGRVSTVDHAAREVVRVGYIPITDCAQLFLASERDRTEFRLELVPMAGGSTILQALAAGTIDVAFSNLASASLYARNAGPLVALDGGTCMDSVHSEAGTLVLMDAPIRNFADLSNRTVAVNAVNNIVDLAIARAARRSGLAPASVKRIEVPFKDMEIALRAGRVDAIAVAEPFLSSAIDGGGVKSLGDHFVAGFDEVCSTGYFTTPAIREARAAVLDQFNAAIRDATSEANTFDASAVSTVAAMTKVPPELVGKAGRPLFVERLPADAMSKMQAWLIEEGMTDNR